VAVVERSTNHQELGKPHVDSWLRVTFRAYRKDRFALVAGVLLTILVTMTIAAPLVSPFDPYDSDPRIRIMGPGTEGHLLGLDSAGRDVLTRVIWGGRVSLPLAVTPVLIAMAISMTVALMAGYHGGWVENVLMRVIDVIFAFPTVVLAIVIAAFMGNSYLSVLVAVTIVLLAPMTRVAYIAVREQINEDYVDAARALGASPLRLMFRHIAPNAFPSVLVYASTLVGLMVVFVAGLSFLGLGLQPPTPDWGLMVSEGRQVLGVAPHVATVPGIVIGITALCFNLIGDGLRFALDPRIRNIG
jgi:ABC-type dipeptide/oligopeptide/nickel transport system permease subunit